MEYLAKYITESMAEITETPGDPKAVKELKDDGFMKFVPADRPADEQGVTYNLTYQVKSKKVYQVWAKVPDSSNYLQQIEQKKAELSASDYKIIKCYESSLVGDLNPYNVAELHAVREALRVEINELESIVKNL